MLEIGSLKYYYQWKVSRNKAYLEKVIKILHMISVCIYFGMYVCILHMCTVAKLVCLCCMPHVGAFGVVHKGELKACDGTLNKTVAIKTIKCELLYVYAHVYLCVYMHVCMCGCVHTCKYL